MQWKKGITTTVLIAAFLLTAAAVGGQGADDKTPSVVLRSDKFQFRPILDGIEIQHTFAIQNKGAAVLEIQNVRTD
ncbi:MAG: hypothetical protein A2V65_06180 [Deltaproteobacteria bacterium RBG_13_49_15]|nr:MAG: hypothetical protein A2V65_06180 [Deltaproteobacteria bacterium RBG_13_49_15]